MPLRAITLKVVKGPKIGTKFQLKVTRASSQIEKTWIIGRSEKIAKFSKGISIPTDAEVSGKHAKLELLSGKKLKITDLNRTEPLVCGLLSPPHRHDGDAAATPWQIQAEK